MNKLVVWSVVAFLLVAGSVLAANSDEVTLAGQLVCAKCTLHQEGLDDCQNALVVESEGDARHYYLENNATNDEFGDICMKKRPARVTGSVTEHDGHIWIAATAIELVE